MVESINFVKKTFDFANDSVQVTKRSFGPNGLDCMLSTTSRVLLVTNNGYQILKSLSFQSPFGRFLFKGLQSFYSKTGDFSKKFFLLTRELLCEVLSIAEGVQETQRQQLAFSQGMHIVLVNILPELLEELKNLGIAIEEAGDLKSIEEKVISIIKTNLGGKFSSKTCNELTNLLKTLLFDTKTIACIRDLKSRVETLVDTFSEVFWEVPGLPLSSSAVLPGIVIPRGFVTMTKRLPDNSTNELFKFILLGMSLGYNQPQSKTVLELRDSEKVKVMLQWRTKFIKKIIQQFVNLGIKLIVSSEALHETVIHFCNQFQMAAIQLLPQEDIRRICDIFKITPMFELELEQDLSSFIGEASCCKPIGVGQHTYVYLEPAETLTEQVLLYAPSEPMCRQYSVALQNALKSVKSSFQVREDGTHMLSLVPGGGVFELGFALVIERYRNKNKLENKVQMACCILEKALLSIPRQLIENLGKQLPIAHITAQAKQSLDTGTKLLGLSKNGTLCYLIQEDVYEPLMGNYRMVSSVVKLFVQITRTDQIIHVKVLPNNVEGDESHSDDNQDLE